MALKLRELFLLPRLKDLKVVAGASGLDRNLHWIHVVELPNVIDWTLGGELLFMTGIGIRDNIGILSRIVEECARRKVAGIVLNIGPYIPETPKNVIELADDLGFPIFELPWEVKLVEVTKEICNHIMTHQLQEKSIQDIIENLLYGDCSDTELLASRASLYNYDLGKPHRVMLSRCIRRNSANKTDIDSEQRALEDKLQLQQLFQEFFRRAGQKVLSTTRSDRVVLIIPSDGSLHEKERIAALAEKILQCADERLKNSLIHIGWGNAFKDLAEYKISLEQAELSLKVAQTSGKKRCFGYEALGFYKVLFNVSNRQELEAFRSEILQPLHNYDQRHNGELLVTLSAFLEDSDNVIAVAERLHIHRNTLRYRLQKIEEITGRKLTDTQDRMHLYFATVVDQYLSL
jgi:purine catabolism regulator